ncbi:MAG: hypothetical protein HY689_14505 [Chloroflexi bacterium]|nr:hypothetical protein [Chloroflexota bacterium]
MGAGLLVLALVGCSSPSPSVTTTASQTPDQPTATAPAAPQTRPVGTPAAAGDTGQTPVAIQEFSIRGREFSPSTVTVQVGSIGLWTNHSDEEHVVAGPGWELGPIGPGQAWAHTFKADEVGTVTYRCKIHPEMTGQVVVTPAES